MSIGNENASFWRVFWGFARPPVEGKENYVSQALERENTVKNQKENQNLSFFATMCLESDGTVVIKVKRNHVLNY